MANKTSLCLLFLSFLIFLSCSGFSYHDVLSTTSGITFLEKNKISKSQIQLFITDHRIWRSMFNFKSSIQQELKKEDLRIRRSLQDVNPASGTPDTPAIITVPSTNPVTVSPTNPAAATPVTVPSSTPPTPTNPANSPVPVTVPGSPPVTSSYPPPSPLGGGSVPGTNSQPPPSSSTNAPATSGQSWCVAKTGISQTTLQTALDYACGTGTADCSQIQQGGSCYNPNSLQNHASFAFNSYYQKNPAPTSCDFGGVANVVTTNPSTGTCIFPSSSGGGGGGGAGSSGSGNGTTPIGGGFGPQSSPDVDSSHSTVLRPFLGCMIMVVSLVCGRLGIGSYI